MKSSDRLVLKNHVMMKVAQELGRLGTCFRRKVGAVLIDANYRIIATGYNGVPRGQHHCTEDKCPGSEFPPGQGLSICEAVHAEVNALLQCSDVNKIYAVFCTTMPCFDCMKLLLNTSCEVIFYQSPYPHEKAFELWQDSGRRIYQLL